MDPTNDVNIVVAFMPRADIGGSGTSGQSEDPSPQPMLRAKSSGHAFFGDDHWSRFRIGTSSERLRNFFNSASYVSYLSLLYCHGFCQYFILLFFCADGR